jgi:predicted RNA-binding protein YlxR (DUF448 family)
VAPKQSLLRWAAVDGAAVADAAAALPGRGAYTCRAHDCIEQAARKGGFNRAFRRAVTAPRSGENVHLDEE